MIADVRDEANEDVARMMERLRAGDVRALARAVSIVEDGGSLAKEIVRACREFSGQALRIAVTGSTGAGKSTLVDQMARTLRREGKTVGVVAVDPSSAITGGALLGDRIRMKGFAGDEGVYIRSMASRGAKGGLSKTTGEVCAVMAAAGREVILIETLGVGQVDLDVLWLAHVTVLVLTPGMGDEVQSLKAGLMEVANVFVVNKSDCDGAERLESEIISMQGLVGRSEGPVSPVMKTVATTGEGVAELMEVVVPLAHRSCDERVRFHTKMRIAQKIGGRLNIWQEPVLDHLGVAVRSIAAAQGFYKMLGLSVGRVETVEHEKVKTAMLPLGESRIELLEATEADSVIGRFVEKRGEGLHHVAVRVGDVDAMFEKLTGQGVRLASDAVRVGAGGHRYFFVHPASTGGVLLEIVGDDADSRKGGV